MLPNKPRRPRSVTILAAGVLTSVGMALLRLVSSIQQWSFLETLPGNSPLYIAITGLVWSVTGGLLCWGLWQASAWAPRLARLALPAYAGWFWVDRVWLSSRQDGSLIHIPSNAGFVLLVTILCLGFCYWALARPASNLYFGDRHERTS